MSQYRGYFVPGGVDPEGLDRYVFAIEGAGGFPVGREVIGSF